MSLDEIFKAIDGLSNDEFNELDRTMRQKKRERDALAVEQMSPEEWITRFKAAAAEIREGFTDEEWAQVEHDMNVEYIEPWDEAEWRD